VKSGSAENQLAMTEPSTFNRLVEDPAERISEIIFGLIMVLTFTSTMSVLTADRMEVRTILIGAIGCNLAWGIIDGGLFLLGRLIDLGRDITAVNAVRSAAGPQRARRAVAKALPPFASQALSKEHLDAIRKTLARVPVPAQPRLTKQDWVTALGIGLLCFLSTFPVVLPFLFFDDVKLALRISNSVAIAMLFLCGYAFGQYAGFRPWTMGFVMVVVGSALTGVAIALGG
jgi:hypothetical protein